MSRTLSAKLSAAVLLGGCLSAPLPADQPARISSPTEAGRAELARVIAEMLAVDEVPIADDALTNSSILLVERRRLRSIENAPLGGRDLGRPERFRLVKQGQRCVLVHEGSERRFELTETECVAESL